MSNHSDRYWLTDKGWEAARQIEQQQSNQHDHNQEAQQ